MRRLRQKHIFSDYCLSCSTNDHVPITAQRTTVNELFLSSIWWFCNSCLRSNCGLFAFWKTEPTPCFPESQPGHNILFQAECRLSHCLKHLQHLSVCAEFAAVMESKVQQSQRDLLHKMRNKALLKKNTLVSLIAFFPAAHQLNKRHFLFLHLFLFINNKKDF